MNGPARHGVQGRVLEHRLRILSATAATVQLNNGDRQRPIRRRVERVLERRRQWQQERLQHYAVDDNRLKYCKLPGLDNKRAQQLQQLQYKPNLNISKPRSSVTFTVSCATNQPSPPKTVYGCFFTLSVGSSPSGASSGVSSSPSSGTYFVQSGSSLSGSISAQSSVSSSSSGSGQSWYQFDDWSLSFSGSGTFYWNGVQVSSGTSWNYGRTFGSFIYDCPSGLTQNVTASFTATANYVYDYITLSGPASVSLNPGSSTTTATYTLSWSIWPYNAYQVAWSLPQTGNSYEVEAQLSTSGGSYTIYWTTNLQCSAGTLLSASESISPSSASVSGSSGSTTATVTITYTCSSIRGP